MNSNLIGKYRFEFYKIKMIKLNNFNYNSGGTK